MTIVFYTCTPKIIGVPTLDVYKQHENAKKKKKKSTIDWESYNLSVKAKFRILRVLLKNCGWNQELNLD